MSDKFRISKTSEDDMFPWYLEYPDGFADEDPGELHYGFTEAVARFVEAVQEQCPCCLKGAVVDTPTGWECKACGNGDTAAVSV